MSAAYNQISGIAPNFRNWTNMEMLNIAGNKYETACLLMVTAWVHRELQWDLNMIVTWPALKTMLAAVLGVM